MAARDSLPLEPTPEMIAAGADALEHVNDIGRWLAEAHPRPQVEGCCSGVRVAGIRS